MSETGALYTLISILKFIDMMQYEIDTLNSNLKWDSNEINL